MKLDSLHCALLVAIVLLAVYVFGSFREGACNASNCNASGYECATTNEGVKCVCTKWWCAPGAGQAVADE